MKRSKNQKGITLVALIITIIVLLILAVVAIREVQGDGIIAHAIQAREKSEMAKIKEEAELVKLEKQIELSTKGNSQLAKEALVGYLNEHFTGSTVNGDIVTTKDEKYDIIVDDALNITVVKHGGSIEKTEEIKIEYTVTGKTANLKFTVDGVKTYEQYVAEDLKDKDKGDLEEGFMKLMGEEGTFDDMIASEGMTREEFETMMTEETGMEYEDYLRYIIYLQYVEKHNNIDVQVKKGEQVIQTYTLEDGEKKLMLELEDYGEYIIEAKSGEKAGRCKIKIGDKINISETVLNLKVSKTAKLKATLIDITGEISWSNSDNTKATISALTGEEIIVSGVAEGQTTITVSCGSYSKTCTVTVKLDHSEVVVPITDKTGVYTSCANIKEVRKGVKGDIPIPEGFTYIKGDDIGGAVISDQVNEEGNSIGNEFVWVPVSNLNEFARPTSGTDSKGRTNYQGVLYSFSGTTSTEKTIYGQGTTTCREPDNLTDSIYGDSVLRFTGTNVTWTETLYQETFNEMVESVAKYKGFYVGRYEMSYSGTAKSIANVKSAINDIDANNWWGLYAKAKTYTQSSIESEMIWGSQYDAMMRWMAGNGITVTNTTPTDLSIGVTVRNTDANRITGSQPKDKLSNIYDLLGNSYEWTQEANNTYSRVFRGGGLRNHC